MLSRNPWIISLIVVVALAAWIATGMMDGNANAQTTEAKTEKPKPPIRVSVRPAKLETLSKPIVLYGRTAPNRTLTLKAETQGQVSETLAERGAPVQAGQQILRLATEDRQKQLDFAKAQLVERELQWDGAKSLNTKGFQGKTDLAGAQANLKETQALIARLQLDMDHTQVRAPFDAVLQERMVETGDTVLVGDPLAQVADLDPIIVKGDLAQMDMGKAKAGDPAFIKLLDGRRLPGQVRYVASVADDKTNTFRIEIAADNKNLSLVAGLTAEIEIPQPEIMAVRISQSLLALNEAGQVGIKWVKDGQVQFTPIDMEQSDSDGAWVTGLSENIQIITVGQAFVREGDTVEAVPESKGAH